MSKKATATNKQNGSRPLFKPKLRFPEFELSNGWKKISLHRLAQPVTDRATTGSGDRVLSLSGEHGLVLQSDYFGKKIAGESTDRYLKIRKNDFVYNDRTTKASSFGTIKRLSNYSEGIVSPIYKCFRFQPSEKPVFWEWYFESGSHDPELGGLVNEGARAGRFNISVTKFLSTNAWRPDEHEQQKIAECLDSMGALIAAQGRKVEALMAHKSGLMQQLFPQEGETQPRLRFSKFRDADNWEIKLGGELFTNRKEKGEAGLPIYSVTMHEGMVPRSSLGRNFHDIKDPSGNKKAHQGDIAYNMMRMWQGALGTAPEDCMVSPAYVVLKPRRGASSDFFSYFFKLPESLRLLTITSRGLTKDRLRLYFDDFAKMQLRVPSKHEQQRIADCLTSLDNLIAIEARKLDTLKTHKKGLLQQLFPSVKEADA